MFYRAARAFPQYPVIRSAASFVMRHKPLYNATTTTKLVYIMRLVPVVKCFSKVADLRSSESKVPKIRGSRRRHELGATGVCRRIIGRSLPVYRLNGTKEADHGPSLEGPVNRGRPQFPKVYRGPLLVDLARHWVDLGPSSMNLVSY